MRRWTTRKNQNVSPCTFENSEDRIFSYHDLIVVLAVVLGLVWEKSLGVDSFLNHMLQTNHVSFACVHICVVIWDAVDLECLPAKTQTGRSRLPG